MILNHLRSRSSNLHVPCLEVPPRRAVGRRELWYVCRTCHAGAQCSYTLQPILEIMLQKAFQARSRHCKMQQPVITEPHTEDELSIFGGRTRLVKREESFASPALAPSSSSSSSQSRSTCQTPNEHPSFYPQPQGSLQDHSRPQEPRPGKQVVLPDNYLANRQATFADLTGGWDGLFHEVPQSTFGSAPSFAGSYSAQLASESAMLDDHWISFMHNYSILEDPSRYQGPMY